MAELLGRVEVLAALAELAGELGRRGVRVDMFVVGGAAMALAYAPARRTRDVDAVFSDPGIVYEAARAVARRLGLPADWLNDAVRSYLLGPDAGEHPVYESEWLQMGVASAPYLLAMKLLAARVEQYSPDILALCEICGCASVEDGRRLLERYLPGVPVPARSLDLLSELLGERSEPDA